MKLSPAALPKALRKKDVWIVIGGAAAAITAAVALRGSSRATSSAAPASIGPLDPLPAGSTAPSSDLTDLHALLSSLEGSLGAVAANSAKTTELLSSFQPSPVVAPVAPKPAAALPVYYPTVQVATPTKPVGRAPTYTYTAPAPMQAPTWAEFIASRPLSISGPGPTEASTFGPVLTSGNVEDPLRASTGITYPGTATFIGPTMPANTNMPGEAISGAAFAP